MLRKLSHLVTGSILIIGLLFRFMHWPYAGGLLIASLCGITILLFEYAIRNRKMIYPLLGVVYVLSILFKMMHFPGANNLLIVSFIGMSFALLEIAFRIRKSILAILPLLFSITLFFVLFRFLHWPEPPYVLYGSYFLFLILVPVLLFIRGSKLKNNEPNISRRFMGLSVLSFILCGVEYWLKMYPERFGMEKSMHFILPPLILLGLILYIRQTLQIQQLNINFQNEHKLLQCLEGAYLILLVLLTL